MLVACKGNARDTLKARPVLDRQATILTATQLFPNEKLVALNDVDLSNTCPDDDELIIGSFAGGSVMAAVEFSIDYPSKLPSKFIDAFPGHTVYLHAMHSAVDWFAYVVWKDGKLQRSLSLSSDRGVIEDIGGSLRTTLLGR